LTVVVVVVVVNTGVGHYLAVQTLPGPEQTCLKTLYPPHSVSMGTLSVGYSCEDVLLHDDLVAPVQLHDEEVDHGVEDSHVEAGVLSMFQWSQ